MGLACGCKFEPGKDPDLEAVRTHYQHTFGAMMYWELMLRFNRGYPIEEVRLSQARIAYFKALDEAFPAANPNIRLEECPAWTPGGDGHGPH